MLQSLSDEVFNIAAIEVRTLNFTFLTVPPVHLTFCYDKATRLRQSGGDEVFDIATKEVRTLDSTIFGITRYPL